MLSYVHTLIKSIWI